MREHGWTLQCTVNVKDTADATYFCVVGWGPGGYSGIKQVDSKTRLAIFSMWNDDESYSMVSVDKTVLQTEILGLFNQNNKSLNK